MSALSTLFPYLKLLVVLVEDAIVIEDVWDVRDNDFEEYEGDWRERGPRTEFI